MNNTKKQLNSWFTITTFVDIETGEVLNPKGVKNGEWQKIKLHKLKNKHSGNNYSKQQVWICRRTGQQLTINFGETTTNR